MNKRIAILRGINVGGKRKLLMADLKSLFEQMNFTSVSTYIQSGNVFFDVQEVIEPAILAQKIENAITEKFGYDVPVIIRTPKEIATAIQHNPF
ncbi:MAG: DUF1697 domain-containing protein [Bacteroidota bacterium]